MEKVARPSSDEPCGFTSRRSLARSIITMLSAVSRSAEQGRADQRCLNGLSVIEASLIYWVRMGIASLLQALSYRVGGRLCLLQRVLPSPRRSCPDRLAQR